MPDRFVRKWLQLRLNAQRRGRIVTPDVTPDLLRRIDVAVCPVSRIPLTHGELAASDWSVDRLNNDGAYAANNLAVMSTGVNRAKGDRSFEEVRALAEADGASGGLLPVEWSRLAALMLGPCFATRPSAAPLMALNAPIAPHSARPAAQQIQHVFTTMAARAAGKNLLVRRFKAVCRDERSQTALGRLADSVHLGLKAVEFPCDVWLQPSVMPLFVAWRHALDEQAWAMAGEVACVLAGARRVPPQRLDSWRLETRGYAS